MARIQVLLLLREKRHQQIFESYQLIARNQQIYVEQTIVPVERMARLASEHVENAAENLFI